MRGEVIVFEMRLSARLIGKDNNLNLLRFLAAFAVLCSHSVVLCSGKFGHEPLRNLIGLSLGDLAVDVFFAASGFLVARSLAGRGSGIEFLWGRFLRIYPALAVMLVGTVLLAPVFGTFSMSEVLRSAQTRHYLYQNFVLVRGVEFTLPGMFDTAPWKGIVNGSLWTMTYEVRLYLSLLAIWWPLRLFPRRRVFLFKAVCSAICAAALGWEIHTLFQNKPDAAGLIDPVPRLVLMFYSGVVWWIASRKVLLDWRILFPSAIALAASWWVLPQHAAQLLLSLWIPYAVWWFAFVPRGRILAFNRVGDASYGIYIYAFPLQQMWVVTHPNGGPAAMIACVGCATVALGFLSWHLLEKRALSLKGLPGRYLPGPSRY